MALSTDNHLISQDVQDAFFLPSARYCGSYHCVAHSFDSTEEPTTILPPGGTRYLEEVPREYFVQSLRTLAPNYWDKSETSDCTIIVPIPQVPGAPLYPTVTGSFAPQTQTITSIVCHSSDSGQRATEPAVELLPCLHLQLHVDYLSTHSSYIRALLSGTNPLNLVRTSTTMDTSNGSRSDYRYSVPANRLPRLLPGPPNHPTLYLPVPDPSSFRLIAHWMYFGSTALIEECLYKKVVHWEGLARNVEYLGVSSELKLFLRSYYYGKENGDSGEDPHTACHDSGYNSEMADCDSIVTSGDESYLESENEKGMPRGRLRIRQRLPY